MKKALLLLSFWLITIVASGQQTVGVLVNTAASEDGYVLFDPYYSTTTYLIDKSGNVVHTWTSKYISNRTVNLLPDGSLLRPRAGAVIEKLDWNSNILWSYTINNDTEFQSHEVYPMPNGNVMAVIWEYKTAAEGISQGLNPALLQGATGLYVTKIQEIQPVGTNDGKVVWQWDTWNHLIQDYDSTKPNYGVVAQHPELININYITTKPDDGNVIELLHSNAVTYNAKLNQVIVSHRYFSEFWILDHSTTTAQAATRKGGVHNKGGDLLYRWGNDAAYGQGSVDNEQEFGQHNVQWIASGYPGAGNIIMFNNGYKRPGIKYSAVDVMTPPVDSNGNYSFIKPYAYGPLKPCWTDSVPFYFSIADGGTQRLMNGNTLISASEIGTFYEVDSNMNVVWEYINPYKTTTSFVKQGTLPDSNLVFRCTLYQTSYSGLAGKDLIVANPVYPVSIYPNPFNNAISVIINSSAENVNDWSLQLTDVLGRTVYTMPSLGYNNNISLHSLPSGIYFITILTTKGKEVFPVVKQNE